MARDAALKLPAGVSEARLGVGQSIPLHRWCCNFSWP